MASNETILRVKDLRISFRTVSGKLQAVRDVSFNLQRGETLAIVGESGSGKSVTNKAIMGILAKNAIIEGGEILYDGRDLLKTDEEDFHYIRGDKIAMIFQDPLSSLNPIIRIGRQLTEATLLKNRSSKKNSKKQFLAMTANIEKKMGDCGDNAPEAKAKAKELLSKFRKFEAKHVAMARPYEDAKNAAKDAIDELEELIFDLDKNVDTNFLEVLKEVKELAKTAKNDYVLTRDDEANAIIKSLLDKATPLYRAKKRKKKIDPKVLLDESRALLKIFKECAEKPVPDLFSYGYWLTFVSKDFPSEDVEERNTACATSLESDFMGEFRKELEKALKYSHNLANENKVKAVPALEELKEFFSKDFTRKDAKAAIKPAIAAVKSGINPCSIVKDSYATSFETSITSAVDNYFKGLKNGAKDQKRFDKEDAKFQKKVAAGKTPDWKPVPANVLPKELLLKNILTVITGVEERYKAKIGHKSTYDEKQSALDMIEWLKDKVYRSVYSVTKVMAKNMAIKLMKEVGIPEPRRRYRQYPFEFSGGMRQRIVIAIALAANPEILICDEPTTALDVTIQAQILELINKIKAERKLSVIFITHNLGVVANMADQIAVMYAGKIVEYGTADDVFYDPRHPYTWALLSSMPDLQTKEKLEAIPGTPPNMIYPPKGDAFAPRNRYALNIDFREQPPMFEVSPTHFVASWLCHPSAPKVTPPEIVTARIARMKAMYGKEIEAAKEESLKRKPDEAYAGNSVKEADFAPISEPKPKAKKGGK